MNGSAQLWRNEPFDAIGTPDVQETIGDSGNCPTSFAMIASTLRGMAITPPIVCNYVKSNNLRDDSGSAGVKSRFFEAAASYYGLRYPRWAVWENVPGALSSQHGQDFRCVLESLIRIKDPAADVPLPESGRWLHAGEILGDGYSLAWRVLDAAQGWGVAQRRKRIFAVLDLDGQCAGKVLFESEGVSGYTDLHAELRGTVFGNAQVPGIGDLPYLPRAAAYGG